jgi:hypothetical protein
MAVGLIIGMIVGGFMATVFYAVRWNQEHEKAVYATNEYEAILEELEKQRIERHPHEWVSSDDPMIRDMGREAMHERHPTLIKPGTEVIRIDSVLPDPEPWHEAQPEE